MSEWWTYHLHDFLLFSTRTYYRLFELYNRDVWPMHVVALLAAIVILILALRRSPPWHGRVIAIVLAASWLWIAWAFQLRRYATIQWAAKYFAIGFVVEALLLIWTGVIRDGFRISSRRVAKPIGITLFLFALLIEPFLGLLGGHAWTTLQVFGIAPDPTVVATIGVILFAGERVRATLLIIPILWCAISGATLWALHA
jgi:uncharacterized protein DUF6064